MQARLISITPEAEKIMMYCARVSNPKNQDSTNTGLLKYCFTHGHWSVFEMANMVIEIKTSRAISAQILRHRSFSFQEFSQRYAEVTEFESYDARRQDLQNKQNSIDDMNIYDKIWFEETQRDIQEYAERKFKQAIGKGIAKEQARFLLPMSSSTTLYMNGTIRSWIHYLNARTYAGTQKEHRDIALEIKDILVKELPVIGQLLQ